MSEQERARGGECTCRRSRVQERDRDGARVRWQETDRVGARETQTETERGKRVPAPDSWVPVWREERLGPGGQVLPEPCACMVGGGGMHTDTWAGGGAPGHGRATNRSPPSTYCFPGGDRQTPCACPLVGEPDGEQLVLNHTNKSLIFKGDRILAQEGQCLLCPSACCVPALRTVPGTWQAPQ